MAKLPADALAAAMPTRDTSSAAQAPVWTAAGVATPTWHTDADADAASPPPSHAPSSPSARPALGQESIELARAYIDLGDNDTARSLLQEVVDIGDADARTTAATLLREMS